MPMSCSSESIRTRGLIGNIPCSMWCPSCGRRASVMPFWSRCAIALLSDWWQYYYEPMDAHQQREITSSVITKLSKFASSRVARRILGQPRSTIDLREVVPFRQAAANQHSQRRGRGRPLGTDRHRPAGPLRGGAAEQATSVTGAKKTLPGTDRRVPGLPGCQLPGHAGGVTQVRRQLSPCRRNRWPTWIGWSAH